MRQQRILWIKTVVVLCYVALTSRAADGVTARPSTIDDGQQGVVLLSDGGVLAGKVTRAADWFVVSQFGGQLQVAATKVLFIGRSLREAYEFRRQQLSNDSGEGHLALAEWCLRHALVIEARCEITTARRLLPGHPKIALLERRVTAVQQQLESPSISSQALPGRPNATGSKATSAANDLPDGVLEHFTRKVQPILVNNCTAARCHEPGGAQAFQLNRALLRGEANRRTTMQNLTAALTLVDRQNPGQSELLTLPRRTHGGLTGPVLGPRQAQAFKHLADWVEMIAPPKPPDELVAPAAEGAVAHAPIAERGGATSAPASLPLDSRAASAGSTDDDVSANNPESGGNQLAKLDPAVRPAAAVEEQSLESLRVPHRLRYGMEAKQWQPRDPFDPEIFNRRQRAAVAQPTSTAR